MFGWLTSQWRGRAASLLVALYALCLVTPTAALAFSASPAAAHCLTDDSNHGVGSKHVHADETSHRHSNTGDDEKGQTGNCCGLFCLSVIAPPVVDLVARQLPPATHLPSLFMESLSGRGSDRIDRPPRSLLPL